MIRIKIIIIKNYKTNNGINNHDHDNYDPYLLAESKLQ